MAIFCAETIRKNNGEGRCAIVPPPKYQFGVLEDGWQYRRKDDVQRQPQAHKRQCLPPFKGCSVYKTSYRHPPATSYEHDYSLWQNKEKTMGFSKDLLSGYDTACRENFTTTTDLVYRILPQLCPKLREYNSNALEWFPPQNYLHCYGNLTQNGLKEKKHLEWKADSSLMIDTAAARSTDTGTGNMLLTTYWDHYRQPPHDYLVKDRRALDRKFSSSVDPNNNSLANQKLRGKCSMHVPIVDPSTVPMPECRFPLAIVPSLPEDPPYKIGPPASHSNRKETRIPVLQDKPWQTLGSLYPVRLPVQAC